MNKIIYLSVLLTVSSIAKAHDNYYNDTIPIPPAPPSIYTTDLDMDGRQDTIYYDNENKQMIFRLSTNDYSFQVYSKFDLQETDAGEKRMFKAFDGGFSIEFLIDSNQLFEEYKYEKQTGKFRLTKMYFEDSFEGSMSFDGETFRGNWLYIASDYQNANLPPVELIVERPFYWNETPEIGYFGIMLYKDYRMMYEPDKKEIVQFAGTSMDESDNVEYFLYYDDEGDVETYGIISCNYNKLIIGEYAEVTSGIYFYTEPGDGSFHAGYNIIGIKGLGTNYLLSKKQEQPDELSFIQYEGKRYKAEPGRLFKNRDGSVTIDLLCNDFTGNEELYQIYLTTQVTDYQLPDVAFYKLSGTSGDGMELSFYRHYPGWNGAYHKLKAVNGDIYIQQFDENMYLIAGKFKLNSRNGETVNFLHYGELIPDVSEVKGIISMSGDDINNNEGNLVIDGKQIPMDYGFYRYDSGRYRYYVADRLLMRDRAMEYGVYFDSPQSLPEGKFTQSDTSQLSGVGLFELDNTIIPNEYTVNVKYNTRKRDYIIDYKFILPDGRIVSGKYRGRLAKMQMD